MIDPTTPEGRHTQVKVNLTVDTKNLRKWAGWHADRGHADVAHALYRSAERYDDQACALDRVRAVLDDWTPSRGSAAVFVDEIRTALDGTS